MVCYMCKQPVYFDQRDYVKFVYVDDDIDRFYHLNCFNISVPTHGSIDHSTRATLQFQSRGAAGAKRSQEPLYG